MAKVHQMHVRQQYFDLLKTGSKSVEFRLNDVKRQSIKTGDNIRFICQNDHSKFIVLRVSGIVYSSSFETLVEDADPNMLGGISQRLQIKELDEIYDSASVQKYGVVALILEGAA